jgi:hypothetical protein
MDTRERPYLIIVVAAVLGALLAIPVVWVAGEIWDRIDEPDTFEGITEDAAEGGEPELAAALEAAVDEAVEDPDNMGKEFQIERIELTASNPHITAYKVVISPKG